MKFNSEENDKALRAIAQIGRIRSALYALLRDDVIDAPEYHDQVARWYHLEAGRYRVVGNEVEALKCEALAASQYANPRSWEGPVSPDVARIREALADDRSLQSVVYAPSKCICDDDGCVGDCVGRL